MPATLQSYTGFVQTRPFAFSKPLTGAQSKKRKRFEFEAWLVKTRPKYTWTWTWTQYVLEQLKRLDSGEIDRIMLFLPPQHGKSSLVTESYTAWRLVCNPELRAIIGAYNQRHAETFGRRVRRLVSGWIEVAEDRKAAADWETTDGGGCLSVGVGVGVTGRPGDLIVIDDPIKNRSEAESPTYRDRVWKWYTDDVYTRLQPGGQVILIQTRWHEDDLAGRILASEDGPSWTLISLPAEAEENDPLGRAPGEPLCPERFDAAALADRKRVLGSYSYAALYQQRPAPAEGALIKQAWLRFYDVPPDRFDVVIQSWDMAFKAEVDSSYVVGQVWGRRGADCYLIDQVRARLDFPATIRALCALSARYPEAKVKLVEDDANGPAVIQTLRGQVPGLVPVRATASKLARAAAISWLFEAGNVWLPRNAPWIDDYVGEICTFPSAANDDQMDATSQALARLTMAPKPFYGLAASGAERAATPSI